MKVHAHKHTEGQNKSELETFNNQMTEFRKN